MIEFDCEHCGKQLHLDDSYAGRDGWCRACKQMVIVPSGGRNHRVADLPQTEGIQRLQRLLQYAATKADKFKIHLAQQEPEGRRVAAMEETLRLAYERVERQENAILDMRESEGALRKALEQLSTDSAARINRLESMLVEAVSQSSEDTDWIAEKKIIEGDLQSALEAKTDLQSQLDEMSRSLDQARAETAASNSASGDWEIERAALQTDLDAAQAAATNMQRQLEEKSEAIVALESTLANAAADNATSAEWEREKAALEQDRDTARREVETLHEQLTQQSSAVIDLEASLAGAEDRLATRLESEGAPSVLEEELHTARAESNVLKAEVEAQRQRITTLEADLAQPAADLTDELDALGAECESLRAGLAREEQQVAAVTADQATLQAALTTAQEAVAQEHAQTEAALAQQLALQAKLDHVLVEKQKDCQLLADQASRLRGQEGEIAQYKGEISVQTESLVELRDRHDERDRSMRDQIRALEEQVSLFDTLKDRMAGLQERVTRLDQEHLDLTLTLEDAKRKLGIAEKKSKSLEDRLEETAREKASFLIQIEDLERDCTCKSDQVAQLSEELKSLSTAGSSADLERDKDRRALQLAEDCVQSLRDDLAALQAEKDSLVHDLATGTAERDAAKATYEALEAQMGAAGDSSNVPMDQLYAAEERVATLEAALKESTDRLAEQEESAQNAVRDLAIARKTIDTLEQELSELDLEEGEDRDDEPDSDPSFQPVDSDDSEPIVLSEIVSDRQLQKERKQMMDVLSDFLDK